MDDNKAFELISAVKKKAIIWNLLHPFYKNLRIKGQAWKSVGRECRLSVDAAKRKWKGLRDSYAREMNKRATSEKNVDASGPPQWKFTESMNFLAEHMKLKSNNYDYESLPCTWAPNAGEDVSTKSVDLPEHKFEPFTAEAFYTEKDAIDSFDKYVASSTLHPPTPKRTKMDLNLVNTIKSVIDVLAETNVIAKASSAITFEDELFCRSMSEKLSTFPLAKRNEAKLQIMKILCHMEANLNT